MKITQVYNTTLQPRPPGLQSALVWEIRQQHPLTAGPRRLPRPRLRSPASGAMREPRANGGRDAPGQPPEPAPTARLSPPSSCPGWTFLLLVLVPVPSSQPQ